MKVTTYKSDTEAEAASLLDDGKYPAQITKAEEQTSSNGNDMLVLTVKVWDMNGTEVSLKDWIVDHPMSAKKIRHLAVAAGIQSEYDAGRLPPELLEGKQMTVEVAQKTYKDKNGVERAVNNIKDYEVANEAPRAAAPATTKGHEPLEEEDIPF